MMDEITYLYLFGLIHISERGHNRVISLTPFQYEGRLSMYEIPIVNIGGNDIVLSL